MPARESWHNVGVKIRQLRKTHQLTIKQLANGCGLSPNAISLLERGEVAPTVATLCKIASALGVPASSLFREACPNEVVLTRANDHLNYQPVDRALATLRCTIDQPKSEQQQAVCSAEFVLCLSGEIEYEADGQCYSLSPGDSLSYNGNVLHCWRNRSSGVAVAVMVLYADPEEIPEGE
jgi:transcriptional regulator with XRE-family HTH domain